MNIDKRIKILESRFKKPLDESLFTFMYDTENFYKKAVFNKQLSLDEILEDMITIQLIITSTDHHALIISTYKYLHMYFKMMKGDIMKKDKMNAVRDDLSKRSYVSGNTLQSYVRHIRLLDESFEDDNEMQFLYNPMLVSKKIDNMNDGSLSNSTKNNYINAIIAYHTLINYYNDANGLLIEFRNMRDVYYNNYKETHHNNENETKPIPASQAANFATKDELDMLFAKLHNEFYIINKKISLTQMDISMARSYMLFNLLKEFPVRSDFSNTKYVSKKDYNKLSNEDLKSAGNLLVKYETSKLMFVINNYKTSSKYGEKKLVVEGELLVKLKRYIRLFKIKLGDYIFDLSAGAMSKLLIKTSKKLINKNLGTTLFAKSILSANHLAEKQKLDEAGAARGTAASTLQSVYIKSPPST